MSSSSDIEKLFDHFGGDARAYQEIGRENEARSARMRWPLLETLDLTQPAIPAIGQRRELEAQPPASEAQPGDGAQDKTPKDAASVTRAKAPLFTRSPRRDIPPVVVAAAAATPSGGSRFGVLATGGEAGAPATPAIPPTVPVWTQTPALARAYSSAPAAPAAPAQPASILGKLFAPPPQPAPPQAAAASGESAPLQSVFDRLRGNSAPTSTATAPAGAPRAAAPNAWLVNGPRRS